ncbi:MAG: hypothetical protein J0G96_02375 [Flavobacteriia bacterium]|uniref:hypothetical protein n=1 Tax=uncultured Flavobacterium sp. TaxID=165435 RepID=UPI0009603B6F|nr:hypothetical protein [uncultured Flavobacterium sp.]MBN9292808.1 hypothetical protein [Flavobacteriia bacterium]OJX37099.1 MAG: hypothetical protein BGO87_15155 [Flavobacteriia bacterium 40-80]
MINKKEFIQYLEAYFSEKALLIHQEIEQLRADISSDTKSTAGDKHETSRAMAQLEMEKLGNQILDYHKKIQWIKQLGLENPASETIQTGSLIRLSNGWYFLGPGLGKITFGNEHVFCISIKSPIGQQLFNKKKGQLIELSGKELCIESIF